MTRTWVAILGAIVLVGSAYGVGFAQTDAGAGPADAGPSPDGGHFHGGGHGALHAACEADLARLCAGVEAGGGRVIQCIREHHDELSDGCKAALQSLHGGHGWRHDAPPDAPA